MQKFVDGFDGEKFAGLLKEYGCEKYFLVCDGAYDFLGIKDVFENCAVPHEKFDRFTPNPRYDDVEIGVKKFLESGCTVIVAVGGGSTIDVAKCIKLYSGMDQTKCFIGQEYLDTKVPLIAVPTTAGTGSESTRHAVIYYKGVKQSVSHGSIVPDVAVLEPSVLKTLPLYQKKCTVLDALAQGIESYWSVNSTEESRGYSRRAISLICAYLDDYIFENTDEAARRIMEGANLSGRAINITQTTAAHAMSYKISSLYNFPHGHAVAVCLPKVWRYMLAHTGDCIDPRGEEHLKKVLTAIAEAMGQNAPEGAAAKFDAILEKLGMGLPDGGDLSELDVLADSVNPERLRNNPVRLDRGVLYTMYSQIVKFSV